MTPTATDVQTVKEALTVFPWFNVDRSTLGGENNASMFIKLSLDSKETWQNNILQNSRWCMFSIQGGKLSMCSGGQSLPKFRKTKVKDAQDVITKILNWKEKVQ